jgi:hypothetical protein
MTPILIMAGWFADDLARLRRNRRQGRDLACRAVALLCPSEAFGEGGAKAGRALAVSIQIEQRVTVWM